VSECVASVIEDDEVLLAGRRTQAAPDLLEVEGE
jgi:hypothetical protein